jgi:hypothetical protein
MCIYHDQNEMYEHLVEFCGASENVRNNRGQTPMLLAASLGKVEMFQHIYNRRRRIAWTYGPVRVICLLSGSRADDVVFIITSRVRFLPIMEG